MDEKRKHTLVWLVTGLVALTFLVTGGSKVFEAEASVENFARWGYSVRFMQAIGGIEIAGAIGILIPRTAPFAAIGLILTMLGAIRTGTEYGELLHIALPAVLVVLLTLIALARWNARSVR